MKKLNQLLAFFLMAFVAVGYTACTDDAEAPTVTVTEVAGASYMPGTDVTYEVTATTVDELSTLTVTGDPVNPNFSYTYEAGLTTSTQNLTFSIPATAVAGSEQKLTFTVTTSKEGEAFVDKSFTVVEGMNTYSNVTLSYNSTSFALANIFSAADGTVLKGDGDASKFDFAFAYNGATASIQYVLAAPNSSWLEDAWYQTTWTATGKNATQLNSLAGFDFDNATPATLGAINVTSPSDGSKWDVQVGDVYGFITTKGQKGAIKIKSLGSVSKLTASIVVDVKVTPVPATAK